MSVRNSKQHTADISYSGLLRYLLSWGSLPPNILAVKRWCSNYSFFSKYRVKTFFFRIFFFREVQRSRPHSSWAQIKSGCWGYCTVCCPWCRALPRLRHGSGWDLERAGIWGTAEDFVLELTCIRSLRCGVKKNYFEVQQYTVGARNTVTEPLGIPGKAPAQMVAPKQRAL